MKQSIALVFPKSTFLTNPMVWPPLGLFYLASQLEARGHRTDFYDMSFRELDFGDGDFDQVWISAKAPQMYEVRKIAETTKNWTKTKTVFGGAAVWANPYKYKNLSFDMLVAGESDHPDTISYIIENTEKLYFAPISKTLDWVLPPIRRWTTNYHAYMTDRNTGKEYRMASMFTSRGCGKACAFCESGRNGVIWDRLVRFEPIHVVEAQIKEIADLGFTGIGFYDDILPINKRRVSELMALTKKYNMKWRCFLRTDLICQNGGKNYLKQMQDGGLIECFVGVESADNQIKKNIHKGTTIEQDEAVLNWCKELGITCKMSFIIGLPGEGYESLNKTKDWILKHRPHIVQTDRLIPFPGTPLTDHPELYDLKYEDQPDEEWFFRGRWDLNSKSFVSTSHLTVDDIDRFWHELEKTLLDEGLSGYNH